MGPYFQILVQNKLKPDMPECDFYMKAEKSSDVSNNGIGTAENPREADQLGKLENQR